jgi:heme exporter protein C
MAVTTDKSSSLDVVWLVALVGINHVVMSLLLDRMVTSMGSGALFALAMMPISAVLLGAFTRVQRRWERKDALFYGIGALALGSISYAIYFTFLLTPNAQAEAGGLAQKIFYFHVPVAYGVYVAGTVCLVASALYLIKGKESQNAWAKSGAECAALYGALVMCSGPLWAKKAWGVYWTWDPRLTTLLLSVLIYVAIVLLRAFTGDGRAERLFASALGVLGTANLPIIHYSVAKWGGNHPTVVTKAGGGLGHPTMYQALWLSSWAITVLFTILILWLRARSALLQSTLDKTWQEAVARGVVDTWHDEPPAAALPGAVGTKPTS